jgi:hypothetical protein
MESPSRVATRTGSRTVRYMKDGSGLWNEYNAWWKRVTDRQQHGITPARMKLLGLVAVMWLFLVAVNSGL